MTPLAILVAEDEENIRLLLEEWLQLHPDSSDARILHARFGTPLAAPESTRKTQVAHR